MRVRKCRSSIQRAGNFLRELLYIHSNGNKHERPLCDDRFLLKPVYSLSFVESEVYYAVYESPPVERFAQIL